MKSLRGKVTLERSVLVKVKAKREVPCKQALDEQSAVRASPRAKAFQATSHTATVAPIRRLGNLVFGTRKAVVSKRHLAGPRLTKSGLLLTVVTHI